MRFHVRCFLIGYALLYVAASLRAETRFSFHVLGSEEADISGELLSMVESGELQPYSREARA